MNSLWISNLIREFQAVSSLKAGPVPDFAHCHLFSTWHRGGKASLSRWARADGWVGGGDPTPKFQPQQLRPPFPPWPPKARALFPVGPWSLGCIHQAFCCTSSIQYRAALRWLHANEWAAGRPVPLTAPSPWHWKCSRFCLSLWSVLWFNYSAEPSTNGLNLYFSEAHPSTKAKYVLWNWV